MTMTGRLDPVLEAITSVIVEYCDPDEVVLFGSWAKGATHRYSDVDLLVIGPFTTSTWIRDRELREALHEFPVTIDLHLLTPPELAVEVAKPYTYLNTLRATSRSLYRRS